VGIYVGIEVGKVDGDSVATFVFDLLVLEVWDSATATEIIIPINMELTIPITIYIYTLYINIDIQYVYWMNG
jgi:hypothetical protein